MTDSMKIILLIILIAAAIPTVLYFLYKSKYKTYLMVSSNNPFAGNRYVDEGKRFADERDAFRTIHSLKMALRLGTSHPKDNIYNVISQIYFGNMDFTNALENAKQAYAINNKNIDCYINMGNALTELNETNEAIGYYIAVLKVMPNNVGAVNGYARALYKAGEYRKCIDYLNQHIEANDVEFIDHSILCTCYCQINDFKSAQEEYIKTNKTIYNLNSIIDMKNALKDILVLQ